MSCRNLVLILGDQLDRESAALGGVDASRDRVLMIESREESQRVWSHKARTALFLSAMRHHRDWLTSRGIPVDYVDINQTEAESFASALSAALQRHWPRQPAYGRSRRTRGSTADRYRGQRGFDSGCKTDGYALSVQPGGVQRLAQFAQVAADGAFLPAYAQALRYLDGRRQTGRGPLELDKDNRKPFGRAGPGMLPSPPGFPPDEVTRGVLDDVERHFPDNPGSLDAFDWPVTREQALVALDDFIAHRLPAFGPFQDAIWRDEPYLHHSLLAAALNLKLLSPREVIDAAVEAAWEGHAPLQSVEGFVRQILGWREYVRGIYWSEMPDYLDRNALGAHMDLPGFYWSGDTDMACLRQAIGQTLELGYAHHIQRLMVTGLFAMLLGVQPRRVHAWYLAVYVDAVEWVEAPNTLGMSQYADGGLLASKPYAASGRYIQRMSNHCDNCRYAPDKATGENACPFTTLYWDFLMRHEARFASQPRTALQWRNLARLDDARRKEIRVAAQQLRSTLDARSRIA